MLEATKVYKWLLYKNSQKKNIIKKFNINVVKSVIDNEKLYMNKFSIVLFLPLNLIFEQ